MGSEAIPLPLLPSTSIGVMHSPSLDTDTRSPLQSPQLQGAAAMQGMRGDL